MDFLSWAISEPDATQMFVTVGICTYNRAESLRRTLDSLAVMEVPDQLAWEVLIVNNNSGDHTDAVIDEYRERLPVRREFEACPGKSHALNRAIDTAKGDYILWTDDDVLVDTGWLKAYVEAFRRWPEAAVFGGGIIPRFEPPVPRWLATSISVLGGPYAVRDFGDEVQPLCLAARRIPYGANFAIRSKEQRTFRYNTDLGPSSRRPRLEEETEVLERILQSGAIGYWIPHAIVEHCIGRDRQTVDYIWRYSMILGESQAIRSAATTRTTPFLFGVPRRLWARLAKRCLYYYLHRLVSPPPIWSQHLQAYANTRGSLRYWRENKR